MKNDEFTVHEAVRITGLTTLQVINALRAELCPMNIMEISRISGESPKVIRQAFNTGELKGHLVGKGKVNRHWRSTPQSVAEWVERRRG